MARITSAASPSRGAASMKQRSSRSRVHLSAGPERLPSPGAPRVTLARAVQDPPPCSWLCHLGAGFRRLVHLVPACAEIRLGLPRDPGLITPGRAGQTPPVDFCNHHGSQARPQKLTRSPCTPRKGSPPCAALRQAASRLRASAGRAVSNPGASMVLRARQRPSVR
jgi:hypothetical protein